ncbi:MAG: DUF87 domain-containing protein [Bacillota bacterium]|nr:DUF87 domain-containing protein [Bacillota bacterium]
MDFEKLGIFYLGRPHDPDQKLTDKDSGYLLYRSKDLTTHAVCVGMTGSGKTGLCIGLLEEAAMDGIPALVIDPKGDMANLMLTFPNLSPEEFRPWINENDAQKAGISPDEHAGREADKWRRGLAAWGQDGDRIRTMRQTTEFAVYTPGSSAGLPISILQSFKAPTRAILEDTELLQEQIGGLTGSLLSLIGLDADPINSREHILVANILLHSWTGGQDLDLAELIRMIQDPPLERIGVMSLDAFYPAKERFNLALRFNNLLASPGFASWLDGEPLDISRLLYTSEGKPRLSILSIAHLNESERMFFVSLLLNQMVSWMRSQPGTASLRAILYMDEIFGFFPPVANPPSKAPLLTLLKQARAYGVGVVLTTQNPVDLDYKGLSNTGTWFIGRLQTERDKMRVIEGLEGATSGQGQSFNRSGMERLIAGLGNRIFLMHSVHAAEPVLFETRWCLSYLRGPLTRTQIQQLDQDKAKARLKKRLPAASLPVVPVQPEPVQPDTAQTENQKPQTAPAMPDGIRVVHAPIRGVLDTIVYQPYVIGMAQVGYADRKYNIYHSEEKMVATAITDGVYPVNWDQAMDLELDLNDFAVEGIRDARYAHQPDAAVSLKNYTAWKRDLLDWAYRTCRLTLLQAPGTGLAARPGEDERDFRLRLQQKTREIRDQAIEKLKAKYTVKMKSLEEKIRKAEQAVTREAEQAKQQKMQTAISLGTTILSAFLGRKAVSVSTIGKATTTVRGASRSLKESGDISRAKETVKAYQEQLKTLEEEFQTEADNLAAGLDPLNQELTSLVVQPFKKDIQVKDLIFAWMPFRQSSDGDRTPAWK